jgi:recombination protein RecA
MASPLVNAVEAAFLPQVLAKRADVLKHLAQSERYVKVCPASRLEVRFRPELLSSGIAELDALTGGIPCGCMTVLWGGASSGKTSALLAALARNTQDEGTCVLIDASDSFDPKSAVAAGVNLGRLLWVRCGEGRKSLVLGPRSLVAFDAGTDGKGREDSQKTTSKSERPTTNNQQRVSVRRTTYDVRRSAESQSAEHRLEQVLKSTDLILQSGGFRLVALDLAGIAEKYVRRIPLASWFRFQRAVEHTRTALLVVSEFPCAQTCATLAFQLSVASSQLPVQSQSPTHAELLQEMRVEAEITRSRLERRPMQSVRAQLATKTVRAR